MTGQRDARGSGMSSDEYRQLRVRLDGGALTGMSFVVGDWPNTYDEPPGVLWLAEVDGQIVGHTPDKDVLNAVAAQERRGLPGWTPYERARDLDDVIQPPIGGVWRYSWARRIDPNAEEPRLQAVS